MSTAADNDDLGMRLGDSPLGLRGAWTGYVLAPDLTLLDDEATGRLAQVTPTFLGWLTRNRLGDGHTVTQILGLPEA